MLELPITIPIVTNIVRGLDEIARRLVLPRLNLLALFNKDGLTDTIGQSVRDVQQLQHMTGGTLTHPHIIGNETVVDNGGTGSVAVSSGTLTITGMVWEVELSNGWLILFGNDAEGIAWNLNGPHLNMDGVTCGEDIAIGSDWLNQVGYLVADGEQYYDDQGVYVIPTGTIVPNVSDYVSLGWERDVEAQGTASIDNITIEVTAGQAEFYVTGVDLSVFIGSFIAVTDSGGGECVGVIGADGAIYTDDSFGSQSWIAGAGGIAVNDPAGLSFEVYQ